MKNTDKKGSESIAILIVMYRDTGYLPLLINSIKKQEGISYQIFAIDNDEKQLSAKILMEIEHSAIVFPYQDNLGYAGGNNYLARKAMEKGFTDIFIVNPDIILEDNCLYCLWEALKSKEGLAIAGPVVLKGNPERPDGIQFYALNTNFRTGYSRPISMESKTVLELPDNVIVNMISGCAFLIKSEAIDKCGLFNEENFMYGDEIDLAYRLKLKNYKCIVTKKAIVWHDHIEKASKEKMLYFEYFYKTRNRILFIKRYYNLNRLILSVLHEIVILPIRLLWLYRLAGPKIIKSYYLGFFYGLKGLKGKVEV